MLIHATEEEMPYIKAELQLHRESGGILQAEIISEDEDSLMESSGYEATTLLHLTAKYGNSKATKYLIDNGYNVNVTNASGRTPLMIAIHFSEWKIVKILLNADADIFLRDNSGISAAKMAIQTDIGGSLIMAKIKSICCNDSQAIAKILLEIDCSLARATIFKDTAIVNYMLENGSKVDDRDLYCGNCTALHYAVCYEDLKMVNLLLDRGIDVNAEDNLGKPALWYYNVTTVDTSQKLEILKTMLDRGALLIAPSSFTGMAPLWHLLRGQRDTIRLLLSYVSDVTVNSRNGMPIFHVLMYNCNDGVTEEWSDKDWDFRLVNSRGQTAVWAALYSGNVKAVECLMEKGVDANHVDFEGDAVLCALPACPLASKCRTRNRMKCVEILLRYGADVQYYIDESRTIFDYLRFFNNFSLAKIILAHLAIKEELGQPIKELCMSKINSDKRFVKYFYLCKKWLGIMRKTVICKELTLFEFLTENTSYIRVRARNPKLVSVLERLMHTQRRSTMYYCNMLRRRIKAVMKYVESKNKVILFVSDSKELSNNDYLVENIVDFFD